MSDAAVNPTGEGRIQGRAGLGIHGALGRLGLLCAALMLGGCSFLIASATGTTGFDPETLKLGVSRESIEKRLGSPSLTETDLDGMLVNTYVFRQAFQPNIERGVGNVAMDLATAGLWEPIGIWNDLYLDPMRRPQEINLTFDPDGKLVRIVPPPVSEIRKLENAPSPQSGSRPR